MLKVMSVLHEWNKVDVAAACHATDRVRCATVCQANPAQTFSKQPHNPEKVSLLMTRCTIARIDQKKHNTRN